MPKNEISQYSPLGLFQNWNVGVLKGHDESNTAMKSFVFFSFGSIAIKDSISIMKHP